MRITYLPHARERMAEHGVSEAEVEAVLSAPDEEGPTRSRRLYSQKLVGNRLIRVIYNRGAEEIVVVTVMLRRRGGFRQ